MTDKKKEPLRRNLRTTRLPDGSSFHSVAVRLSSDIHERLYNHAVKECRSVSGDIEYIVRDFFRRLDTIDVEPNS